MARLLLTSVVLSSLLITRADCQVQCENACNGCGSPSISCSAFGLTDFPALSAAEQQEVEILDVSFNNIQTIEPGTFSQTIQLEEVSFERNNLQEIPEDLFTDAPNLAQANFGSNNIDSIPEIIFSGGIASSVDIDLTSNPLNCDCGLRWLPEVIDSPEFTGSLTGTCSSPSTLSGTNLIDLTEEDLICDCSLECVNGTCDVSVGQCSCNDGYTGDDCSSPCPPGTYGAGCLQNCSCVVENVASTCNAESGSCHCLPGYAGSSCQDVCPMGMYGQDCEGRCQCENGAQCDSVTGECNCTTEWSGTHCNISSCNDGILNNDVDCGGDLCPPCQTAMCRDSSECADSKVCLGHYRHVSNLPYPFSEENKFHCVDEDVPGEAIFQKFKEALLGREGALPGINPQASISEIVYSVQQELEIQFGIEEPLVAVQIHDLEQELGDPLYQTSMKWSESGTAASMEGDVKQMIVNMDSGKLKGTMIINREDRTVILNI